MARKPSRPISLSSYRRNELRNLFLVLLFGITSWATAAAQAKPIGQLRQLFDYAQNLPLDIKEIGVENKAGVSVRDISFASPKGGRVTAYLVVPAGKGKFAGVIFMHPRPGSRNTFLNEALSLAKVGAVSLLIDAPFSRSGESKRDFDPTVTRPADDRDIYIQTVIDLRRGVDLLSSRPDVDPKRIGFIDRMAKQATRNRRVELKVKSALPPDAGERFLRSGFISQWH